MTPSDSNAHYQAPRVVTDYGMIEPNARFRASSRSQPHTMRRASLRTHSTDTRQQQQQQQVQQILPTPSSLSTQMRRPRPRSFSFDEQLSIIDDDDESIVHDMPFSVAPVRPFQQQQQQQQQMQCQNRRLNTSKVSSRCRARRRHRSRSLTKRTNNRQINPQPQQQHEWLHTTDNHHDSTTSEEIEDDNDEDYHDGENEAHFSPRSTSTAANRPRNRKPILHASDFDRRLCEAGTTNLQNNDQENSSPIDTNNIQHHTSPVSQPSTEPDDINLIVYSNNNNDLLNATILSRKSETNNSLKKITCHEKFLAIRYGSPDSGISGKT